MIKRGIMTAAVGIALLSATPAHANYSTSNNNEMNATNGKTPIGAQATDLTRRGSTWTMSGPGGVYSTQNGIDRTVNNYGRNHDLGDNNYRTYNMMNTYPNTTTNTTGNYRTNAYRATTYTAKDVNNNNSNWGWLGLLGLLGLAGMRGRSRDRDYNPE